jgi:hypothetical protein
MSDLRVTRAYYVYGFASESIAEEPGPNVFQGLFLIAALINRLLKN